MYRIIFYFIETLSRALPKKLFEKSFFGIFKSFQTILSCFYLKVFGIKPFFQKGFVGFGATPQ